MQIDQKNQGIQVISRAASILRILSQDAGGMSLGQIAGRASLPRSTVQRIVGALSDEGFISVEKGGGGIRLGPEIHSLAEASTRDMRDLLKPVMRQISDETGETVDLAILDGNQMLFVDQVVGSQRLRTVSSIGERFPLTTTANGKAALGRLKEQTARELILAEITNMGEGGRKQSQVEAEIETIRQGALARDEDEHTDGVSAMGFAVEDRAGGIFAISVPVPSSRYDRVKPVLIEALSRAKDSLAGTP